MKYQDRGLRASGSLFERVREAARSPVPHPVNAGMLQLSIRHNLHNILNTRPGSCRLLLCWAYSILMTPPQHPRDLMLLLNGR